METVRVIILAKYLHIVGLFQNGIVFLPCGRSEAFTLVSIRYDCRQGNIMQLLFQFQYGFCRKHIKAYHHATPEVADALQIGIVYSHFQPAFDLRVFDVRDVSVSARPVNLISINL